MVCKIIDSLCLECGEKDKVYIQVSSVVDDVLDLDKTGKIIYSDFKTTQIPEGVNISNYIHMVDLNEWAGFSCDGCDDQTEAKFTFSDGVVLEDAANVFKKAFI